MRLVRNKQEATPKRVIKVSSPSTVETKRESRRSPSFSPSSLSSSFASRRRVRFDSVVSVRPIPARKDLDEPDKLWWNSRDISSEQAEIEMIILDYQKCVDGCPRWMMKKEQRGICDDLQGVIKYTKLLLSSKSPTEKMAAQLTSCLNRTPDLRSLERRLIPTYDAIMREHTHLVCKMQHSEKNFAKKVAELSIGSVAFGQAVAQHDAAQVRRELGRNENISYSALVWSAIDLG
mmetsp:Transcript_10965/g.22456  ORF Transcript_10965/g.22456 Transcript_10965/m.22456 type:complete len:234 (-) Transcript_10965:180-881(-)